MRLRFNILLFFLLLLSIGAKAKWQSRHYMLQRVTTEKFVKKYVDSLRMLRDSIYSDSVNVNKIKAIDTAPFFLPLTFYQNITHDAFSLSKELTLNDKRLLSVYLSHPELVENTQQQLGETGPVLAPKTVADTPATIVDVKKPQEPETIPVDVIVLKPNFWSYRGDYYLQFLQNYFSDNWYQGGESNYSMMGSVTLSANYNNKQRFQWNNTLEMKFGMQTTRSDTVHKMKPSEDLIRYTGKIGLQAKKRWYYTFQLIAQSQFARHFDGNSNNVQSDFFSPFNVNASIGMDYNPNWLKNKITGSIHLAPLAYNFKYVGRLNLAGRNGIDAGHHTLNDFGSQITINLNWKFSNNMSWHTRLYWYTTYKRTEAEWENTFSFQFNRYLATKIFLYPRFDDARRRDDKLGYFMFKEYVSFGFSFTM